MTGQAADQEAVSASTLMDASECEDETMSTFKHPHHSQPPGHVVSHKTSPLNLHLGQNGLVVTQVLPESTAWRQGIEPGDMIVSVNGVSVPSPADLQLVLSRAGQVAQLQVIDRKTGWPHLVNVYPVDGSIGITCQPVLLGPVYTGWSPVPHSIYITVRDCTTQA
jgi:membrane-associated protease RseP (regulator of RpoE activity)